MQPHPSPPILLTVIELGGYPNFTPIYQAAGYRVESARSVRRALALIKQQPPACVVAEFNFQSDFRDRTSSLESLLAALERNKQTRVVVFYEKEHGHQLARLQARFPAMQCLAFPIDERQLAAAVAR